ncbi:MAG: hypothetical protein WB630_12700, partial [Candidatus Acidiferrales bacterium]
HFHFETLPPNLWIIAIINIHAAVKAMKTIQRSVPNGRETKSTLSAVVQYFFEGRFPGIVSDFQSWSDSGSRVG